MPSEIAVNWAEIRQKYEEGMTVDAISDRYAVNPDTVYQRKSRGKWKAPYVRQATKATTVAVKAEIARAVKVASPAIQDAVNKWTAKAHEVAGKLVSRVSDKVDVTEDPEDLQRLAGTLERADTVGRRALGLDKDSPAGPAVVNIAIGLAYRPSATSGGLVMDYAQQAGAQVVDVEPASEPGN